MVALIIALMEDPEQRRLVKDCLERAGHKVTVAESFVLAQAALQQQSFDLIISDVHLQNGGTVFDFLKWVRSDPRCQHIPFVLFSLNPTKMAKYLADGVRTAARTLGASKYISMIRFEEALFLEELAELLPPGKAVTAVITKGR